MGQNKKKQHQLRRLFHRQRGRCHWCGCEMLPPGGPKGGGRQDPRLCTYDHLDCRYSDERGKHQGEYRNVAACWTCNNRRAKEKERSLSRETLWEKSGAYPLDFRFAAVHGANARDGLRGARQADPAIGPGVVGVLRVDEPRPGEDACNDALEAGGHGGSVGASSSSGAA